MPDSAGDWGGGTGYAVGMSSERLPIVKTHKLFIGGQYPRSESGRVIAVREPGSEAAVAYVSHGSRKDLRSAVESARGAQASWAGRDAYNRGQILYRMAEMLEGKRAEFVRALRQHAEGVAVGEPMMSAEAEVSASVDRLVAFAGWADKFAQVLGCQNPVSGPYHNFTIPEPTGVVAVVCPDEPALLGMVSLMVPALVVGNALVVVASGARPVVGAVFGELSHASDVPSGVVNLLTGRAGELASWVAGHREVDAVYAANLDEALTRVLRAGAAENLKRVTVRQVADEAWGDAAACEGPGWIEPVVEFKTMWHPARV